MHASTKTTCYLRREPNKDAVLLGDKDNPLFLTPLINSGQLVRAKGLSRVGNLGTVKNVVSYSGFLTVNADLDSNLFFWFFPAEVWPPLFAWISYLIFSSNVL